MLRDGKVWIRKNELSLGNYLGPWTQPKIIRQRTFKITDIDYDQIKY